MSEEIYELKIEQKVKHLVIRINGVDYSLSVREPSFKYIKECVEKNDCKRAISDWIYNSIDESQRNLLDFETIYEQDDAFFDKLFTEYLKDDEKLFDCYNCRKADEDVCSKFVRAYIDYSKIVFASSLSKAKEILSGFCSSYVSGFSKLLEDVIDYKAIYQKLFEGLNRAISSLRETICRIKIPQISDERKQELIDIYKQWGNCGWTPHPQSSVNYFDFYPETKIDADNYALKVCNKDNMEFLFNELKSNKKVSSKNISEAIMCYNNKCYKACSLILFSLIDRKLIKLQKNQTEENIKTGTGAICVFKKKVEKENKEDISLLYFYLIKINLFQALFKIFEGTENFTKKCDSPNRNYLIHGMTLKPVRKKDCIKLFLILYNLLDFVDIMEVKA